MGGYSGDGMGIRGCLDIDECDDGSNMCHPTAFCFNLMGSYECKCPDLTPIAIMEECPGNFSFALAFPLRYLPHDTIPVRYDPDDTMLHDSLTAYQFFNIFSEPGLVFWDDKQLRFWRRHH